MRFGKRICLFSSIYILLIALIYIFSGNTAYASDVKRPDEYYFVINGQQRPAGSEFEMKSQELLLSVAAGKDWDPGTTVEWVSSETSVVTLEQYDSKLTNFVKLKRKGPGYSTITAIIRYGTYSYSISCLIKVNVEFDHQKTGTSIATTTNERILIMNVGDSPRQIYLKYVDYVPDGQTTPVSGGAISAAAVTWESDNESVAKVDDNGKVTPVGCGSALITVTTKTLSTKDKTLSAFLRVVITPAFSLTYDDYNGNRVVKHSGNDRKNFVPAEGVPSNFIIESKATYATNLKWEVYDSSTNRKLSPDSDKLKYSISENSGNVVFTNVKAGTYEIYAFANENYNVNTNAPYAYMKIIVPIYLGNENIVMNVGDKYSIADNSNIPDFYSVFQVVYKNSGDSNIAQVDQNGIITAKRKGKATITLVYKPSSNLYDDDSVYAKEKTINVTVIDGIALSATEAVLYTQGTLLLQAIVSDPSIPITWSSDAPAIAKVENGLVTALRPGVAVITAQQIIDGVVKTATCEITVQQSITNITIDPANVTIAIGEYKTLNATITPKITGAKLTWKTSNDKVVKIVETNPLTVTIQGVSGGNAVISAINEDNIVVGYSHVTVRQPVTSIKLSDTNVTASLSAKTFQLRAIVYPENALNKEIRWTSTNPSIARVNESGLVTFVKNGDVTIIATSVDNPEVTAMCNFTITVPVTSVALDEKEITMYVGQTKRLTYTVVPINASKGTVTWTSSNPSVATVDASGKVTARQVGSTVIMVKTVDGGHTAYCTIEVRQIAENVKFNSSEIELITGQEYEVEYTVVPSTATDISLVWESSDTRVITVDDKGKVTAKGPGVAFVMVRTEGGGISYLKVTVKQSVTGLILNFAEKTLYVNDTFELKASVIPSNAYNLAVEWKSSNPNVATVSANGEVTAVSVGTSVITCTTKDGGYKATCVIIVKEKITSMRLNYSEYQLSLDKTVTLSVIINNQPATDYKIKWVSSNSDIASVDKNGKVTPKKIGKVTIYAYAQDGSGAEASCEIQVVRPVSKITLNETYLTMWIGETKQLKAKVEPGNATNNTIKWVIEGDSSILIIDEDGYITALKEGSVIVKAMAQDDSGKFAVCQVIVNKKISATSVVLPDNNIVMVKGEQRTLRPVINPINSTDNLSWSTDNSAVASVNSSGKITAKATGTANITVMTDSGKTATVEVNVIGLNVSELTLEQYSRYTLQVEGATTRVTWDVADPEIAEVRNGVIITKARGTTIITANVNGRKLTCKLTVTKIR